MIPALRASLGVCVLGVSTVAHAATPITLPLGSELALLTGESRIELPIPPPPRVARPDVSQMRLVIKPQPKECEDGLKARGAGLRLEARQGIMQAGRLQMNKA